MAEFGSGRLKLWYGTADATAPTGEVASGTKLDVTVGVEPPNPANVVIVRYRVNWGAIRTIRARRLCTDHVQKKEYFQATFPPLSAGDIVEYVAICQCAGRQAPDLATANKFPSSFRVQGAEKERPRPAEREARVPKGSSRIESSQAIPSSRPDVRRGAAGTVPYGSSPEKLKDALAATRSNRSDLEGEIRRLRSRIAGLEGQIETQRRLTSGTGDDAVSKELLASLDQDREHLLRVLKEHALTLKEFDRIRARVIDIAVGGVQLTVSDRYPVLLFPVRLETRFMGTELWVRLYPDQVAIETHEPDLTVDQVVAGRAYTEAVQAAKTDEDKQAAWRVLARLSGPERAAWIVKEIDSYDGVDELVLAQDEWTEAPKVRVMPDRFVVRLYRGDQIVHEGIGKPIPDELAAFWDPKEETNEEGQLFDNASRWLMDFDEAHKRGMALKFTGLDAEDMAQGFTRVIAVGVKGSLNSTDSADLLESLIDSHHYTSGVAFLPNGVPTNNTNQIKSAHSDTSEDIEKSYTIECADGPEEFGARTNAKRLADALGVEPTVFKCLENAREVESSFESEMHQALWPATLGYLLRFLLPQDAVPVSLYRNLSEHLRRFVYARGPLPAIRIGNLPYGVLPVSKISEWKSSPLDSWPLETNSRSMELRRQFDESLYAVLLVLYERWHGLALDSTLVPRIGATTDPDKELLQILSMEPTSSSYRTRPIFDTQFMSTLFSTMGPIFFGSDSNFNVEGQDADHWMQEWSDTWQESNQSSLELLGELFEAAGSDLSNLENAPIMQLFSWGDGYQLSTPLAIEPAATATQTTAYLQQLANGTAAPSNTLLIEFLKLSLMLEQTRTKAAIESLAASELTGTAIQSLFQDMLDLCTHRLDAWMTSFPTKRLQAMRFERVQRKETEKGIYLGAFGWVEDLKPKQVYGSAEAGGHIHAPSPGQAVAGAVIRSSYLSHLNAGGENQARLNLTSDRVRLALRLLNGLGEGQPLGALLGYQFERGLHERGLDQYKDKFRAAFPIDSDSETDVTEAEITEAVAPRNVADGLALANAVENVLMTQANPQLEQIIGGIQLANAAHESALWKELHLLVEALDGIADLMLYESVFQSTQGKYERAGAACDTLAGYGANREVESVQTPFSGVSLRHRILVVLQDSTAIGQGPRSRAEPRLDAWAARMIGDLGEIGCTAHFKVRVPNGEETKLESRSLSVADLGLGPLDLLYMSFTAPSGEATELEQRISYFIHEQTPDLADEPELFIDFADSTFHSRSLADAIELANHLHKAFQGTSFLKPPDLCRPEEVAEDTNFVAADYSELYSRVVDARNLLSSDTLPSILQRLETAANDTEKRAAIRDASLFGISIATLASSVTDEELESRRLAVIAEIKKQIERCDELVAKANALVTPPAPELATDGTEADGNGEIDAENYGRAIGELVKAMKALFGESFIVLPTFMAPRAGELDQAINQDGLLGDQDSHRVMLWLQQVAQTHPAARRLETALMVSDAWRATGVDNESEEGDIATSLDTPSPMQLNVVQLPFCPNRKWMALSDDEWQQDVAEDETVGEECKTLPGERPRGVMSMVAITPNDIDFSLVRIAGFLIDEFDESIPSDTATTGISFQYDQPSAQAPQALLLAIPSEWNEKEATWQLNDLFDIVRDTADLAKVRLVDLDAMRGAGRFLPALFLPTTPPQGPDTYDLASRPMLAVAPNT